MRAMDASTPALVNLLSPTKLQENTACELVSLGWLRLEFRHSFVTVPPQDSCYVWSLQREWSGLLQEFPPRDYVRNGLMSTAILVSTKESCLPPPGVGAHRRTPHQPRR